MKAPKIFLLAAVVACALGFVACNDDVSPIGGSLTSNEVTIYVDSITTRLDARSEEYSSFDGRNTTKLLGRISVPEYGRLSCSFVTQLMAATRMPVPDSIPVDDVDSVRLVLSVPRGALTGDSLAPQQFKAFRLTLPLPADISTTFSPDGYYDPSAPFATASYALSNIAKGDSALKNDPYVRIPATLPLEFGREIFTQYRTDPAVFQWPETFNRYFPGLYVQQNFGNGCIANISKAEIFTYWHYTKLVSEMQADSTYKQVPRIFRDSVCLMASQPEVVSSNVIDYQVSDHLRTLAESGRSIITTPGGYRVILKFPVRRLLEEFKQHGTSMSVVSGLKFEIPALPVSNGYGLGAAPYLLMIRKSEMESFFNENKVPDNKSAFTANYDAESGSYKFSAMRAWFVDLLEAEEKGEAIDEDNYEFVLMPVNVTTESVTNYDGSVTVYVTRCQPYITAPTMTELFTDRANIVFTYSSQQLQ